MYGFVFFKAEAFVHVWLSHLESSCTVIIPSVSSWEMLFPVIVFVKLIPTDSFTDPTTDWCKKTFCLFPHSPRGSDFTTECKQRAFFSTEAANTLNVGVKALIGPTFVHTSLEKNMHNPIEHGEGHGKIIK